MDEEEIEILVKLRELDIEAMRLKKQLYAMKAHSVISFILYFGIPILVIAVCVFIYFFFGR